MLRPGSFVHIGLWVVVLSTFSIAQSGNSATADQVPNQQLQVVSIVQRMQQAEANLARQAPYQVTREYRLFSGHNPVPTSQVLAIVNFRAADGKDYQIEQQSGSNRGEQVVRRILDHEVEESIKPAQAQAGAITEDNYNFDFVSETLLGGHPCYVLRLTPKRKDKNLVVGDAWVDKGSFLVRHIEGELVKTPSWWLKHVSVKMTFTDVQGAWTQSDVEALADVRLVGQQTLRSHAVACQSLDVVAGSKLPALCSAWHRRTSPGVLPRGREVPLSGALPSMAMMPSAITK